MSMVISNYVLNVLYCKDPKYQCSSSVSRCKNHLCTCPNVTIQTKRNYFGENFDDSNTIIQTNDNITSNNTTPNTTI